ncbi:MAG: hypothetical protein ACK56I_28380, partial [bacterium]
MTHRLHLGHHHVEMAQVEGLAEARRARFRLFLCLGQGRQHTGTGDGGGHQPIHRQDLLALQHDAPLQEGIHAQFH